jgi:HTH-type transcriptional regulator / antitoxin HigA
MMDIRPIRCEADYDWALGEIEPYFISQPSPDSPDADRFDILAALIAVYEHQHWAIEAPDPVAAIEHWMEIHGYSQSDLAAVIGSRSRASELLRRKRALTMTMANQLHQQWDIPAAILIQPYALDQAA